MYSKSILPNETILVVDDNSENIELLADLLSGVGYQVAIAKSGKAALECLEFLQPDLILLDVMMPEIDGFETCRQIKSNLANRDIPIIFMTALSDSVNKVKGLSMGAVDYITKPIEYEETLVRIRIQLQVRDSQKQLEKQTLELSEALEQLKKAQVQMVQNEKMSSLGQLVAGIAHEINNPVNFIHANLIPAEEYMRTLINFVELYQECYPQPHPKIQEWIEKVEMSYLQEDFPKLINSLKQGSERIRQIILSLRNFSRLDEAELKFVNIQDGIDNTLMLLQHRLRAHSHRPSIQVIKEYGELPVVECYPSELNQVFMNILSNAIDVLEERDRQRSVAEINANPSRITIRTQLLSDRAVAIYIIDNGLGIDQDLGSKLFEPFFTTKPIGKGSGLGLSISYQIITKKHGGKISYNSEPGQGTEFAIEIPLKVSSVISLVKN
ncbi:sensor histidine kinase [Phormidium nigroviride]